MAPVHPPRVTSCPCTSHRAFPTDAALGPALRRPFTYLVGVVSLCSSEGGTGFPDGEQTIRQERPHPPLRPRGRGPEHSRVCLPGHRDLFWVLPSPKRTPSLHFRETGPPLWALTQGFCHKPRQWGRGRDGCRRGRGWRGQGCAHPLFLGTELFSGEGGTGPLPVDSPPPEALDGVGGRGARPVDGDEGMARRSPGELSSLWGDVSTLHLQRMSHLHAHTCSHIGVHRHAQQAQAHTCTHAHAST